MITGWEIEIHQGKGKACVLVKGKRATLFTFVDFSGCQATNCYDKSQIDPFNLARLGILPFSLPFQRSSPLISPRRCTHGSTKFVFTSQTLRAFHSDGWQEVTFDLFLLKPLTMVTSSSIMAEIMFTVYAVLCFLLTSVFLFHQTRIFFAVARLWNARQETEKVERRSFSH